MAGGRPPYITKEYILEKAKALEEWYKKPDSTSLVQFCVEQDIHAQRVYEWRDECEEFADVLKKAKMNIAKRLQNGINSGTYNYGLGMRYLAFNDQFIHDYEESVKDRDAARNAKEAKVPDPQLVPEMAKFFGEMNQYFSKEPEGQKASEASHIDSQTEA